MGKLQGTHWENERINAPSRINYFMAQFNESRSNKTWASLPQDMKDELKRRNEAVDNERGAIWHQIRRMGIAYNRFSHWLNKQVKEGKISWDDYYADDDYAYAKLMDERTVLESRIKALKNLSIDDLLKELSKTS